MWETDTFSIFLNRTRDRIGMISCPILKHWKCVEWSEFFLYINNSSFIFGKSENTYIKKSKGQNTNILINY
jgi:hypothetical protein